ncbi:MAG: RNA polymerase sigma factor [Acetobacteraceae bacterium]|nr:RNA polymerase sigma factor [Acetobacteraceae bacterium]
MSASENGATGERFEEHHDALLRFLVRLTEDPDLAADVAQGSFIRLLEHPPREWSRSWLFRVAANLARDRVRIQKRRQLLLFAGRHRVPRADPPAAPDAGVEVEAERRALAAALTVLSTKERLALLVREEGFTQREIAEAVGTTTKSVGTLTARAIRKVARRLQAEHEEHRK